MVNKLRNDPLPIGDISKSSWDRTHWEYCGM